MAAGPSRATMATVDTCDWAWIYLALLLHVKLHPLCEQGILHVNCINVMVHRVHMIYCIFQGGEGKVSIILERNILIPY